MLNRVSKANTPIGVRPISLDELRRFGWFARLDNPRFNEAAQLWANHHVHGSENVVLLVRWPANELAAIARREAATPHLRGRRLLRSTRCLLRPGSGYALRPRQFAPAGALGSPLPGRPVDRLAALRFQPADAFPPAAIPVPTSDGRDCQYLRRARRLAKRPPRQLVPPELTGLPAFSRHAHIRQLTIALERADVLRKALLDRRQAEVAGTRQVRQNWLKDQELVALYGRGGRVRAGCPGS